MSKSIIVVVPHRLGVDVAKQRVAAQIEILRHQYVDKYAASEVTWTGDRADFRVSALAQTVTGQIEVSSDSLRIEVQLPWLLAALQGKLQGVSKKPAST
jgi:hypothetical protein